MSDYQFGAWVVHSTIALNLPVSPCETADVWIDLTEGALRPLSRPFFQHLNADKTVWVAFYHDADGIRVDFPGLAAFLVSADGRFIRCAPEPGLPTETFEHLLLDQVLPRALSHQGHTVLHAAAVAFEGKTIAFLGDTGRGKSTLVRYLVSTGLPFVSDDCLIITSMADPVTGIGSYSGMRLWPDSVLGLGAGADQIGSMAHYGRKRRLALPAAVQFQTTPLPIAQLFLLAPPVQADGRIQITPVPARERVIHLFEYAFRLDLTDKVRSAREFAALCDLAERLPLAWLHYPRRYDRLPDVAAAVRAHLTDVHHLDVQSTEFPR